MVFCHSFERDFLRTFLCTFGAAAALLEKSHTDAGGCYWDYTGHRESSMLSKGLQHLCGALLVPAVEEEVWALVNTKRPRWASLSSAVSPLRSLGRV